MIKYVAHQITSSAKEVSTGSWNLQKGESLEVAMEILGTSPLGDEEAPIFSRGNCGEPTHVFNMVVEGWMGTFVMLKKCKMFVVLLCSGKLLFRKNYLEITWRYQIFLMFLVMGFLVVFLWVAVQQRFFGMKTGPICPFQWALEFQTACFLRHVKHRCSSSWGSGPLVVDMIFHPRTTRRSSP